jgi:hypothetical protein
MNILNKLWQAWKRLGQVMGTALAYVVLTLFYFTLFLPYAAAMTWLSDPLQIRRPRPLWVAREAVRPAARPADGPASDPSIDAAQRQF